jgi:transposase
VGRGGDPATAGKSSPLGRGPDTVRDVEVPEKPVRRRYSAAYKLRILEEADACRENTGELGALLRREGLYSSHLNTWRRQRREGTLAGLSPKKRGRKERGPDEQAQRVKELERENKRLRRRLQKAETILDIQKKASELLGIPLNRQENGEDG